MNDDEITNYHIKDEELKPCPFCGYKNPKHETENHCDIIRCYWCGLFVGDSLSGGLVDKWNRREWNEQD